MPIEAARLGNRTNLQTDGCSSIPRLGWTKILVELLDSEGRRIGAAELLRADSAIEELGISVGVAVDASRLDLEGVVTGAVLAIEPGIVLDSGEGCPVTGRFESISSEVLSLPIEGDSPLIVTAGHPVFSVDRERWVAAGDLIEGELVLGDTGVVRVSAGIPLRDSQVVYNLEVFDAHQYQVGDLGIWVHNDCFLDKAIRNLGEVPNWMLETGMPRAHGHHMIPLKLGRFNPFSYGNRLRDLAKKFGVDNLVDDADNLTIAPNGLGTHKNKTLKYIYDELSEATSEKAFRGALKKLQQEFLNGDIHRRLGYMP